MSMTDEEKATYRNALIEACKTYCHIDYDDDEEIIELMLETAIEELEELIPDFDRWEMTSRQKMLVFGLVKDMYDNRERYQNPTALTHAASSMLLKEMYGGAK